MYACDKILMSLMDQLQPNSEYKIKELELSCFKNLPPIAHQMDHHSSMDCSSLINIYYIFELYKWRF